MSEYHKVLGVPAPPSFNQMKDLLQCSLDELLSERQNAIESGNVARYRECNEIISTLLESKG